jgi:DNA segregation ATPase FtsK/SpoIIIE, S-DNA-T family
MEELVRRKKKKTEALRYEVTGLCILAACGLALGRLGFVGQHIDIAFIYLAGSWSFLVPVFIGYAGIYIMVGRSPFPWNNRHMGLLILLLVWLTGMEIFFFQNVAKLYVGQPVPLFKATINAVQDMKDYVLNPGRAVTGPSPAAGGGLVGYVLFSVFHYLFSLYGTLLILFVATIIGGALVVERSLVSGIGKGTIWMEKRLERIWQGSKQYASLLLGKDDDGDGKNTPGEVLPEKATRKSRRKPELIVEGEIFTSGQTEPQTTMADSVPNHEDRPIIHDFTARLPKKNEESGELNPFNPKLEQVGNQLVMRYPERVNLAHSEDAPVHREHGTSGYTIGAPVYDDNYLLPPISIFSVPDAPSIGFSKKGVQENARKLEMTLESFGVQAKVLEISRGPTVTRYEVQPAVGVKVSRIVNLTDDIALALAARDIRMEAPVPGKPVIGIEVPNEEIATVSIREVLDSPEFKQEKSRLSIALGRDISGAAIVGNLQKMPHLLVAGATGSGKSVCINCIIASILVHAKPHEVKLMMIDPKMVELSGYNGIPHLMTPVVTDPRKAAYALKKVVQEMESRYQLFADRGARDLERYNQLLREDGLVELPYIVVIVDELADLMMVAPGDVEDAICRIAQMARAAGIHLIVATQRPSVDVITGVIKANIPSRIAFSVSSMADSRTILDSGGAEKLLGRGDMLYLPVGASKPTRVQGAFVSEEEIERLTGYVKEQQNAVYTVDLETSEEMAEETKESDLDSLFIDAVDLVVDSGQASVSMIQRRFRVGYSRAARIIDQMELQGLIGHFEGSKPREVLVSYEQWQALKANWQAKQG